MMLSNGSFLNQKADARELAMFHLGMLLRSETPLPQALKEVALTTEDRTIKASAVRAAEKLAEGYDCSEIFAGGQLNGFTPQGRYILAAPISDTLKGSLLSGWQRRSSNEFNLSQYLYYPVQSIAVGGLVMVALIMFVLPQFREILMGLHLQAGGLAQWVLDISYGSEGMLFAMGLPMVLVLLLTGVFFLGKSVFRAYETIDELNLFRMLGALPVDQRFQILEIMAAPHNFPRLAARFKSFASAVNRGDDIGSACEKARLDGFFAWFMQLSAADDQNSEILAQGAGLLESRLLSSIERSVRLVEISSVLLQGLFFGIIVYAIFQTMVTIMLGAII